MRVKTQSDHIILVPKELSGQAVEAFEDELSRLVAGSPPVIELDCSALGLVSSSHVNILWTARETCEDAHIPMRLTNVSERLIRTLTILDLNEFFITERAEGDVCEDTAPPSARDAEDKLFELRLKPVNEEIIEALSDFRQFLKGLNMNPFCSLELETVFYEILTNIRQHGQTNSEVVVELTAKAGPEAIELTFTDNGCAFNPSENYRQFDPESAIRKGQKHGFGLTMIARMTDSMEYTRKNDELNVLKVKKYWK